MLTTQIVRGDITVEQAQNSLLAYAYRDLRPPLACETLAELEQRAILQAALENP